MRTRSSEATRVLVTGGTGFVGSHIIKALAEQHPDYALAIVDLNPPPALSSVSSLSGVQLLRADVTNAEEIDKAFAAARPHVVVHTAGFVAKGTERYNQDARSLTFRINVEGTRVVLDAAKKYDVKAFVHTSSCTCITDDTAHDYPNMTEEIPLGLATLVYGESKGIAERMVLEANSSAMSTCAIRPSTLFGVGDYQLVPTIHSCIAKFETPFIVGTGFNLYDFGYCPNIADAHVLAIDNLLSTKTAAGEAFFISNGEPVPFRAFMLAVWAQFGHYPPFQVRIPRAVAWCAGYASELATWLTGSSATLSRGSVKDACQTAYASIEKARHILGYEPRVGMSEGLRISCEAYKARLSKTNS